MKPNPKIIIDMNLLRQQTMEEVLELREEYSQGGSSLYSHTPVNPQTKLPSYPHKFSPN